MTTEDYAIIVAGGKGLRMGGAVPKQFMPVKGLPVLMRTLMRFREYSASLNIILVLPTEQHDYWLELCRTHQFNMEYQLAPGGATRFHSVKNGLQLVPGDACGVVAVHDGVRPFVSVEVIARCFEAARRAGAVIPVVPVVETLLKINADDAQTSTDGEKEEWGITVPRSEYRLVQTPQVFDAQLLKAAFRQPYSDMFTDDASVVQSYGHRVITVEGNRENMKLTTPFDMRVAEALSNERDNTEQ
ncbi:MAG: 2-C-methyl-D-erythritol 4-phosphate cytidylyltransferase [Prevotella sp.]|nr:2-C-methyl-D-erythritol 4-phosphate cytidylyltransferase [Prevotella sp.]